VSPATDSGGRVTSFELRVNVSEDTSSPEVCTVENRGNSCGPFKRHEKDKKTLQAYLSLSKDEGVGPYSPPGPVMFELRDSDNQIIAQRTDGAFRQPGAKVCIRTFDAPGGKRTELCKPVVGSLELTQAEKDEQEASLDRDCGRSACSTSRSARPDASLAILVALSAIAVARLQRRRAQIRAAEAP
jgi:hypothetical protein